MTSHSPYPIYVPFTKEIKLFKPPTHLCDALTRRNPNEHIIIEWDGSSWYCGDGFGEGVSNILYCPYCGVKLEEGRGNA